MPNPAILAGDFSGETYPAGVGWFARAGPCLPTERPHCTALLGAGYNCMPVDPLTGQPFPGNIVPADRFTSRHRTGCGCQQFLGDSYDSQPA